MKNLKLRIAVAVFVLGAASTGVFALAASSGFRFCCTTQQSIACAAQGGTATCRTGVCQCLH